MGFPPGLWDSEAFSGLSPLVQRICDVPGPTGNTSWVLSHGLGLPGEACFPLAWGLGGRIGGG